MADLQCAARVFVARHGEAEYESELSATPVRSSPPGWASGVTVRHGLREFGVGSYAGQPADMVPDPFRTVVDDWLDGRLDTPIPGGESGSQVVDRVCGVLDEAADRFRGEAVLVISHGGAICTAIPNLARNLDRRHPVGRPLANCDVVELAVDGDGWVARSWAGEALPS